MPEFIKSSCLCVSFFQNERGNTYVLAIKLHIQGHDQNLTHELHAIFPSSGGRFGFCEALEKEKMTLIFQRVGEGGDCRKNALNCQLKLEERKEPSFSGYMASA